MSKEKLIIALDVPSASQAETIVSEIGDAVGAFKVGLQLFTTAGPAFVEKLVSRGHRIFLDLKFHDIPNTVAKAGIEAARLGVWMFNVHALGGGEMISRTVSEVSDVCNRENLARPLIIGVTVLTSSDQNVLSEVGITGSLEDEVLKLAKVASKYQLDGVVASPLECRTIRDAGLSGNFVVVTPGIRPKSATNDDQKRVTTPSAALKSGADYLVVGRPVTQAADRLAAASSVVRDMESAALDA